MNLLNPDARIRRDAAAAVFKSRDPATLPTLDLAIAAETDAGILLIMRQARAATLLASDAADADKIAAIAVIQERASRDALDLLFTVRNQATGAVQEAAWPRPA